MRTVLTFTLCLSAAAFCAISGCDMPEGTTTADNDSAAVEAHGDADAHDATGNGANNTGVSDGQANDAALDNQGVEPDNTAINERDADGNTLTPLDQGQGEADVNRTADIRSKVLEIENLSINGRNVKIITNEGHVTLRGPVASDDERAAIERIAVQVAGKENVTNELEVDAD